MATLACDVDLRRIHAYSDRDGRVCYQSPSWPLEALKTHDHILVEVASPVSTSKARAEEFNRRRWALSNSVAVGWLWHMAEVEGFLGRILVAPSTVWTRNLPEKTREIMAGCHKQDNHDIRACRCMLWFYSEEPHRWVPLTDYYRNL